MKKSRLVCGVGINDADYSVNIYESINGKPKRVWTCPFYRSWSSMLARCHDKKLHTRYSSYNKCTVTPEWLRFSAFKSWMEVQDWKGKALDKDILIPGNKEYSPEKCVFVSQELNKFLLDCKSKRGAYPLGVTFDRSKGRLKAICCNPFTKKSESLGLFSDPDVAHQAWRTRKHQHACQYAEMQTDQRVADALRSRFAPEGNEPAAIREAVRKTQEREDGH